LSPRWLGWLAAVVVVSALMVWAGLWQLRVAQQDSQQQALDEAAARPVVALDTVLPPHTAFPDDGSNRMVSVTGHYEPARTVLVVDRRLAGRAGYWVITPFVVEQTGARVPVLRGFTASPTPRLASSGMPPRLTVVGSLAPTESPRTTGAPLPTGQVGSVDVGALLNVWGGEVYNGFLFAVSEDPSVGDVAATGATATDPAALERVPPPALPTGLTLRNAAYALQWWVFALFAVWMWGKMVRDDHRRQQASVPEPAGDPA